MSKYLHLPNKTTYPSPNVELGWELIHNDSVLSTQDRLYLSCIIEAYAQLINCTQKERNQTVSMIKEAMNDAK